MPQLLLSFCYTRPLGHVLARFDTETQALEWLDLGALDLQIHGATGLCRHGQGFYAVLQVKRGGIPTTELVEFDAHCRMQRSATLKRVFDAHSIVPWGDALLVVSTGTNQVIEINWPTPGAPRETIFFELDPGADTLHMNALQVFEQRLYLSMFGPKQGDSWNDSDQGCVLDLSAGGQAVALGLRHPHALFVDGGALGCLVSMTGAIVPIAGTPAHAYPPLPGYLRGAASDSRYLYVGVSIPRTHSKSRGVALAASKRGSSGQGCGLHVFDKSNGQTTWLDLSPFGAELYDIVAWPALAPLCGSREQAMAARLHAVNAESSEMMTAWLALSKIRRQLVDAVAQMIEVDRDYATAQRLLSRLLAQAPQRPEWNYYYALCRLAAGDPHGEAIPHLLKVVDSGYQPEQARLYLAQAYRAQAQAGLQAARHDAVPA